MDCLHFVNNENKNLKLKLKVRYNSMIKIANSILYLLRF